MKGQLAGDRCPLALPERKDDSGAAPGPPVANGTRETLARSWLFLYPGPLEAEPETGIVAVGCVADALRTGQGLCWSLAAAWCPQGSVV